MFFFLWERHLAAMIEAAEPRLSPGQAPLPHQPQVVIERMAPRAITCFEENLLRTLIKLTQYLEQMSTLY
jgi:hypothetical protein